MLLSLRLNRYYPTSEPCFDLDNRENSVLKLSVDENVLCAEVCTKQCLSLSTGHEKLRERNT